MTGTVSRPVRVDRIGTVNRTDAPTSPGGGSSTATRKETWKPSAPSVPARPAIELDLTHSVDAESRLVDQDLRADAHPPRLLHPQQAVDDDVRVGDRGEQAVRLPTHRGGQLGHPERPRWDEDELVRGKLHAGLGETPDGQLGLGRTSFRQRGLGRDERLVPVSSVQPRDRLAGRRVEVAVHRTGSEAEPSQRSLELCHVGARHAGSEVTEGGHSPCQQEDRPARDGCQDVARRHQSTSARQAGDDPGAALECGARGHEISRGSEVCRPPGHHACGQHPLDHGDQDQRRRGWGGARGDLGG